MTPHHHAGYDFRDCKKCESGPKSRKRSKRETKVNTSTRMLAETIAHLETGSQSYEAYISEIEPILQLSLDKAKKEAYLDATKIAENHKHNSICQDLRDCPISIAAKLREKATE